MYYYEYPDAAGRADAGQDCGTPCISAENADRFRTGIGLTGSGAMGIRPLSYAGIYQAG